MYEKSPLKYISNIETPCLFLLGGKDRRVPMCQGIEFFHSLKLNKNNMKNKIKCMIFPEDTHAIENPTSENAHWIAVKEWFNFYCNIKKE